MYDLRYSSLYVVVVEVTFIVTSLPSTAWLDWLDEEDERERIRWDEMKWEKDYNTSCIKHLKQQKQQQQKASNTHIHTLNRSTRTQVVNSSSSSSKSARSPLAIQLVDFTSSDLTTTKTQHTNAKRFIASWCFSRICWSVVEAAEQQQQQQQQ